jgi:hypothetical protein
MSEKTNDKLFEFISNIFLFNLEGFPYLHFFTSMMTQVSNFNEEPIIGFFQSNQELQALLQDAIANCCGDVMQMARERFNITYPASESYFK